MSSPNDKPAGPAPFAPQVMGTTTGSFAPQVMGPLSHPPTPTLGNTTGSFAPQVMGPPPGTATGSFAPQVMGPPPVAPVAPAAPATVPMAPPAGPPLVAGLPFASPSPAPEPTPIAETTNGEPPKPALASPFAPSSQDAGLVAAFSPDPAPAPAAEPIRPAMVVPIAMPAEPTPVPMGPAEPALITAPAPVAAPAPAAEPEMPVQPAMAASMDAAPSKATADDELAASPWNTANNPSFNRELLPSAMLAPAPEPPPVSKKAAARAEPAAEEPSRMPWIIVGVLVLVAIGSGVAVWQIRGHRGKDGQIAVPGGDRGAAVDDTPTEAAPSATATGASGGATAVAPRPVPTYRPIVKPKAANPDDPYADVPSMPRRNPTPPPTTPGPAPHRVFGTDN